MKANRSLAALYRQQFASRSRSVLFLVIAWTLLGLLFAVVFKDLSRTAAQTIKIYQALPPAILHSFNISNDYLTHVEKFLSGQFLSVYMLAGGIFALFMGVGSIGGKIEDSTIANLLNKPFSRATIYLTQAITNIVSLIIASAATGAIMYGLFAAFSGQKSISVQYFVSAFSGATIIFITVALLGQLLGMVIGKVKAQAAGSAFIVFSFFLNGLGALAGAPTWLQNTSIFYYFNTVQLRDFYNLDMRRLAVLLVASAVFLIIGTLWFRRKDLYL